MKITTYTTTGTKDGEIELPLIFSTPFRRELIHKAYTNLTSHKFQPQGRHPSAGQDVVADSNDPPTGQGVSRVARAQGGGGGRQGQGAEVASTRGGRQAHPPIVGKVIYKKLNKKENKLALCSAIAATSSKTLIESRGHKIEGIESFPIIISDDNELAKPLFSRVIFIKPIADAMNLATTTTKKIQTVGIMMNKKKRLELIDKLTLQGGDRSPSVGDMSTYENPWDGMFVLDRLVRWISTYD